MSSSTSSRCAIRTPTPTQLDEIRQRLAYDPLTGIVIWIDPHPRAHHAKTGEEAGFKITKGYRRIELGGRSYATAHVAWFLHYGTWPVCELDHEDRVRDHNWISNLREATRLQQVRNTNLRADNTSGLKGVTRAGRRWRAQTNLNGRRTSLGYFDTPELAHTAYLVATTAQHGEH